MRRFGAGRRLFDSTRGPAERLNGASPAGIALVLAGAFGILLLLHLLVDNIILLALLTALAALGADRLLRMHPQARFHGPFATAPYIAVPALFAIAAGALLPDVVSGLWTVPAAVVAAAIFGVTVNAEYQTVDPTSDTYEVMRLVLLFVIYCFVAFAIFVGVFRSDLNVWWGTLIVGVVSALLTVDILRELEADTRALLGQAMAAGLVMAECRIALYFLAIPDILDGALLLLTLYVATGLLQNHLSGRLDRGTLVAYGVVSAIGLAIIVGASAIG